MKITKLEQQKRTNNRFNLEVDGEFFCGVDEAIVVELDLYQGREINEKDIKTIQETDDCKKCLNKAFSLLAIRMNSEIELRKKLNRTYSKNSINKTIIRLKELGYVNDALFTQNWISSREGSKGKFLLRKELLQKGINKKIIDDYFETRDTEVELKNALNLIKKKRWPEMTQEEKFQKVGGYLSRHGFDYDTIKKAIKQ